MTDRSALAQRQQPTERIVVTGLGVVSAIGCDVETYWRNLLGAVSGVGRITAFDPSGLSVQIAAECRDFDPRAYLDPKAVRRVGRFAQMAVAACAQALADADFAIGDANRYDVGIVMATGGGGLDVVSAETVHLLEGGPGKTNPLMVPIVSPNMVSCQPAMQFGVRGPNIAVVGACAAGGLAFYDAFHLLRRGEVQAALCGGAESVMMPLSFSTLGRLGALSKRNDAPEKASRPFDRDRDGFVFGEGAAALLLELESHARRRGARIYAELAGVGLTADAYHPTAPEPTGESAARAIQQALRVAGVAPAEVDYVCAHGTGTPLNDVAETKALKRALGAAAYRAAVSSPKSMVGHTLGAAGALSALTCVLAIQRGVVPPTANLDHPDPECDLDYVPWTPRARTVRVALANAFGFGGQNATVVFRACA
jgi:3-oxoacyl-[acyl-carrier-protein] synthase II